MVCGVAAALPIDASSGSAAGPPDHRGGWFALKNNKERKGEVPREEIA